MHKRDYLCIKGTSYEGEGSYYEEEDHVDRTILDNVGLCILKSIAFDFNNTALQRSTT